MMNSFVNNLRLTLSTDQPNDPDLAALGFLTTGPVFLNRKQLIIDDQIDLGDPWIDGVHRCLRPMP